MKNLLMVLLCCLSMAAFAQKTWNPTGAGPTYLWSSASNWSPSGVPNGTHNVTVTSTTKPPTVVGVANCNSLTITSGVIRFSTGARINVNGDFTNSTGNTAILQGGEITIVGSTSTTINGSTDFNALTVQKTTGTLDVTLNTGTYTIAQFLRLAQGDLITGGNDLTLLSQIFTFPPWYIPTEQTAYIDGSGGGDVIGDVTVTNYVETATTVSRVYHSLCSPIQNSTPADLEDNTIGTDAFNGSYAYSNPPLIAVPHWIYFDEPDFDPVGSDPYYGWKGLPNNSYVFDDMEGYIVRFNPVADVIDWTGTVNNGNITKTGLSYTNNSEIGDGSNLIGNPYPSPINWEIWWAANGSGSDIQSKIWIIVNDGGEYTGTNQFFDADDVFNSTLPNGIVDIGQGFWIKTNVDNNSITFTNAMRVDDNAAIFWKNDKKSPFSIGLQLSGKNNKDLTFIRLGDNYTENYHPDYDVAKMINFGNSIYTLKPEGELSASKIPFPIGVSNVPLEINLVESGNYTVATERLDFDFNQYQIYFEDKVLGINQRVDENFVYHFSADAGLVKDRFVVYFKDAALTGVETDITTANPLCYFVSNDLNVQLPNHYEGNLDITITNLMGQQVAFAKSTAINGKVNEPFNLLASGVYQVNVKTASSNFTQKVVYNK